MEATMESIDIGFLQKMTELYNGQIAKQNGQIAKQRDTIEKQQKTIRKLQTELEKELQKVKLFDINRGKSSSQVLKVPAVPVSVLTDSYKASHFKMYPECQKMVAYGEFRSPYPIKMKGESSSDTRVLFQGMRYILENYIAVPWTVEDVENAEKFYKTHNAGNTEYPFPKELFMKFVKENNGYFPVKIEALEEGTVANVHVPVYQITAEKEYARLVTFLETILTHVWYPSTVATLSRRCKDIIAEAFKESVDPELMFLLDSRLHDFGMRGCTSVEQTILGGVAHLLNFNGSDTMSAAYYAQFHLNNGNPVAQSIPATEHSVMTSWPDEKKAIDNMIDEFGGNGKVFAVVMDSYDYNNALFNVLPTIAEHHKEKGGLIVLRPDSGDPVQCIRDAMKAGESAFGCTINKKGFKVLNGCAAIQGDGINYQTIIDILDAVLKDGYSACNVAFGMGGGLLQKVNRDTMAFATKLSHTVDKNGVKRDIMKRPKTDSGKTSLPGELKVIRNPNTGGLDVFPKEHDTGNAENMLKVVYNCGPVNIKYDSFDNLKASIEKNWESTPRNYDSITPELKAKMKAILNEIPPGQEVLNKPTPTRSF